MILLQTPIDKLDNVVITFKETELAGVCDFPSDLAPIVESLSAPTDGAQTKAHEWIPKGLAKLCKVSLTDIVSAAIPCHLRVTEGFIHLLPTGLLFLNKTTWYALYNDIFVYLHES